MKLSIVVPCYNEEDAVPVFLATVIPTLDSWPEILEPGRQGCR